MNGSILKTLIGGVFAAGMAFHATAAGIDPGTFPTLDDTLSPRDAIIQTARLSDGLDALKPQRPGVTDTYVLSIALWNDPVFEAEAEQAAAILSQRYDAEGRTLIMSVGVGDKLPTVHALAQPETIETALGHIGTRIDPKEDLVIVFVTSHGLESGEVGMQRNGEETLGAMTPGWLADRLKTAGIDTRLVIVSACFSGAFVPYFKDRDTAIFTAASAKQPSFGCNPNRDWTYFGDALFNHGLRGGSDFEIAQAQAVAVIDGWERAEKLDASKPQRHVGKRAGMRIRDAESYGRAIGCVADLSHVQRLSAAGTPVTGAPSAAQTDTALKTQTGRALEIGETRGYAPEQVEAHLNTARDLPAFGTGFDTVGWRAAQCIAD